MSMKHRSSTPASDLLLDYQNTYLCPVCRHGQIAALSLMDAFACDFCRHIFTANLAEQIIRVEDSVQPMSWRWNGRRWQSVHQGNTDLTIIVWVLSVVLVVLPPGLVWLPSYIFPPIAGSRGSWIPTLWLSLTWGLHGAIALWLLVEHYQVPGFVRVKLQIQEVLRRRAER
jgi:hypothetical protein